MTTLPLRYLFFICKQDWWRCCHNDGLRPHSTGLANNGLLAPRAILSLTDSLVNALVSALSCCRRTGAALSGGLRSAASTCHWNLQPAGISHGQVPTSVAICGVLDLISGRTF